MYRGAAESTRPTRGGRHDVVVCPTTRGSRRGIAGIFAARQRPANRTRRGDGGQPRLRATPDALMPSPPALALRMSFHSQPFPQGAALRGETRPYERTPRTRPSEDRPMRSVRTRPPLRGEVPEASPTTASAASNSARRHHVRPREPPASTASSTLKAVRRGSRRDGSRTRDPTARTREEGPAPLLGLVMVRVPAASVVQRLALGREELSNDSPTAADARSGTTQRALRHLRRSPKSPKAFR